MTQETEHHGVVAVEATETGKDARQLLADITAGLEGVTLGPWETKADHAHPNDVLHVVGPSEIVCGLDGIASPNRSNDRTFFEDAANMRHIARCDPDTMQAIADLVAEQDRRIAELEAERQWRPIETAPKDGTWIAAWRNPVELGIRESFVFVRWHKLEDEEGLNGAWVWPDDIYDPFSVFGREDANSFIDLGDFYDSEQFTHWMPLPASPHEGAQS